VFLALVRHLGDHLKTPKQLYRWGLSSLVALLDRDLGPGVDAEIKQAAANIPEVRLQVANRVAVLALSTRWIVYPIAGFGDRLPLIKAMDAFIANVREGSA
jgi:hypothetical protein